MISQVEITKMKTKQQPELEQAVKAIGDDLKKLSDRVEQCEKKIDADGQVLHGNVNLKLTDFEKKLENIEKKDNKRHNGVTLCQNRSKLSKTPLIKHST